MNNSRTFSFEKPQSYISINDMNFPIVIGGIRLIKGVTDQETMKLAESMALKLHYFNLPLGGAKAGINSDDITDLKNFIANDLVKEMLEGVNKFNIHFISGPDIGTSETDYGDALKSVGLAHLVRPGLLSNPSREYKLQLDNIVTALGCITSIDAIFEKLPHLGSLSQSKISIEGFGKVGIGIAAILGSRGKIVSVSTRFGSIYDEDGFQVNTLLNAQSKFGDNFIFKIGTEVEPPEILFQHQTDVIIPGARTEVITKSLAEKIVNTSKPKMIVPTANFPYTDEGRHYLEQSKIICFPDFVSSAGAVIAAMTEFAEIGSEENALELVRKTIRKEVNNLLRPTQSQPESSEYKIYDQAKLLSQKNLISIKQKLQVQSSSININTIAQSFIRKYVPELLNR